MRCFSVPLRSNTKYGNINPFPIDYAFRPRLRGRLTLLPRLTLDRNPWSSGERAFRPRFIITSMSAFALLIPPATLTGHLHRLTERSPTNTRAAAAASVHGLAPLHLPRRPTRPVSYYAFFK